MENFWFVQNSDTFSVDMNNKPLKKCNDEINEFILERLTQK